MPAQKRPLPPPSDHLGISTDSSPMPPPRPTQQQQQQLPQGDGEQPPQPGPPPELPQEEDDGKDDNLSLSPSLFFYPPLLDLTVFASRAIFACFSPDSDGEGGSQSSADAADKEEYVLRLLLLVYLPPSVPISVMILIYYRISAWNLRGGGYCSLLRWMKMMAGSRPHAC